MCDLTDPIGLSQPTVSHHLKQLVDAGLLTREQRGKWAYYRVVDETLTGLSQALAPPLNRARQRLTAQQRDAGRSHRSTRPGSAPDRRGDDTRAAGMQVAARKAAASIAGRHRLPRTRPEKESTSMSTETTSRATRPISTGHHKGGDPSTLAQSGRPASSTSCCTIDVQRGCCTSQEKESCCGAVPETGTCGCRS